MPFLIVEPEPLSSSEFRLRRLLARESANARLAYAHALEAEARERVSAARADQAETLLLEFVRACADDMLDMLRVRELIPMARSLVRHRS